MDEYVTKEFFKINPKNTVVDMFWDFENDGDEVE